MSYVPAPLDDPSQPSFLAHDTRTSTHHPLRHSVLNVIRKVADHRAPPASPPHDAAPIPTSAPTSTSTSTSTPVPSSPAQEPPSNARNGQNYLLTGRTLFTTHEPCIMCAMALLHSRVKEIVYVHAMGLTGGCGGAACVPRLEGVNHRYSVLHWIGGAAAQVDGRSVGEKVDA
ncbi:cytidine deaminase-like protein [Dentipellis sp. KUC8613]|nr:cytidine deaminase-like protein [Dentipellis sp. KUC8613]